jgi:hypothetical protein
MPVILALILMMAVLLGGIQTSGAQSAVSAYPWCAIYGNRSNNARSCYFASWDQCMTTLSGIGGLCVPSPYYRAQSVPEPLHPEVRRHRHRHS